MELPLLERYPSRADATLGAGRLELPELVALIELPVGRLRSGHRRTSDHLTRASGRTLAVSLNFERSGGGEPLILLHGIGGELWVWEPVLEPLSRRMDVIASTYAAARRMVGSYARATAYEATNVAMREHHFTDPERIRVPLTVAFGELDRLIRPRRLRIPDARTVILHGCGHIPMWDAPELVTELILDTTEAGARTSESSVASGRQ